MRSTYTEGSYETIRRELRQQGQLKQKQKKETLVYGLRILRYEMERFEEERSRRENNHNATFDLFDGLDSSLSRRVFFSVFNHGGMEHRGASSYPRGIFNPIRSHGPLGVGGSVSLGGGVFAMGLPMLSISIAKEPDSEEIEEGVDDGRRGGGPTKKEQLTLKQTSFVDQFWSDVSFCFGSGGGAVDCWGWWGDARSRGMKVRGDKEGIREGEALKKWGGKIASFGGGEN